MCSQSFSTFTGSPSPSSYGAAAPRFRSRWLSLDKNDDAWKRIALPLFDRCLGHKAHLGIEEIDLTTMGYGKYYGLLRVYTHRFWVVEKGKQRFTVQTISQFQGAAGTGLPRCWGTRP